MPNSDSIPDNTKKKPKRRELHLYLDEEHKEALRRVARAEHLRGPDAVRLLIRVADQTLHGAESPFHENLQSRLTRKVG